MVKLFLNIFPLRTHLCSINHQNKSKPNKSFYTSCQIPLPIWWFRQSHVLEIGTNTKMVIMITVEYILVQGKISTIGIKSLSGNDKNIEISCSGISWVVNDPVSFLLDWFPTLTTSLHWTILYLIMDSHDYKIPGKNCFQLQICFRITFLPKKPEATMLKWQ